MGTAKSQSTVDYLTVTTKTGRETARLLQELYTALGIQWMTHEKWSEWKFMGYHGRAYEGVRYGMRNDEGIVMLSGSRAQELWLLVSPKRAKCTRIDLAITMALPEPKLSLATEAYEGVKQMGTVNSSYIINSRGGQTAYVGSRHSHFFGRVYDKSAEQGKEPGYIWRFELEIKKPASEHMVAALLESQSVAEDIYNYVATWFTCRGVGKEQFDTFVQSELEIGANVQSDEKTLKWLSSSVRKSVQKLIINGKLAEVLDSLGLANYIEAQKWAERFNNGSH